MRTVAFDEKRIDSIFASLDTANQPGAAVGIGLGGRPVYRKGFGLASIESTVPLSPSTRMRICSASKHFTALAWLLLCEEGRASIDDPVRAHLPELNAVADRVTMRQLMGHVGGLRDVVDIAYQFCGTGQRIERAGLLPLYRDIDDVSFAPGTCWNYNNGGYLLLSLALERLAGRPLEDILRERIFEPLGMHDSLLRRWDTDLVPNSATLHLTKPGGGFQEHSLAMELDGGGGLVSTVDDMSRWLAQMDAPRVGCAATWQAMKTPQTLANGTSSGYGLGLMIGRYRGVRMLSHPGGLMGGSSQMIKVPGAGLDIVILVNRHDVSAAQLANRILDACLTDLAPVSDAAGEAVAAGVFHSPTTGRVAQLFANGTQQIASIDGWDMPVACAGDGMLRPTPLTSFLRRTLQLVGDPANPSSIQLDDFGNRDELFAAEPVQDADITQSAGTYSSVATATQATITAADEGPRLITTGLLGSAQYRLECLAEGLWRARSPDAMPRGGILSFDKRCATFRFTTARNRALAFQRK